jgi:hypothetical protein
MQYFVGLDWAAQEHAVCVVDAGGKVVTRFTVEHTAVGMTELVTRLSKLAPPSELRLAIERPTGLDECGGAEGARKLDSCWSKPSECAYMYRPASDRGSCIVVVATDAPLDGRQLARVAKRWAAPARRAATAAASS